MTLRPALPPASRVLRRDPTHLQVGTSPGIVVRDRPGLRALLRLVDGVRDVSTLTRLAADAAPEVPDVAGTVQELCATGALEPAPPTPPRPVVQVQALDRAAAPLAEAVETAGRAEGWRRGDADAAVLVVVGTDEPPRAAIELATVHRRAVLPVVVLGRTVRIGPVLVAGIPPCLSCLDRERAVWDPAWPAVLTQIEHSTTPATPPRTAPGLTSLVTAHAVARVAGLARAADRSDLAAVVHVGPTVHDVRTDLARPAPGCGCSLLSAGRPA